VSAAPPQGGLTPALGRMPNVHFAVTTPLGKLNGRDCIYLDTYQDSQDDLTLVLVGDINGTLSEHPAHEKWVPYTLHFTGVIAWDKEDLESSDQSLWASSFDQILASAWVKKLDENNASILHHYCIQTYDIVFHVVCTGYELTLGTPYAA
jgi:hypothetical protein